jgi:hypothetical protein
MGFEILCLRAQVTQRKLRPHSGRDLYPASLAEHHHSVASGPVNLVFLWEITQDRECLLCTERYSEITQRIPQQATVSHTNFPHRENPDGTWDSICIQCLRTVASSVRESDLAEGEDSHFCDPLDLERLGKLKTHIQRPVDSN